MSIKHQAPLRNQQEGASRAPAQRRQGASLVGEAQRLTGRLQRQAGETGNRAGGSYQSGWSAERRGTETVPTPARPVHPAPDGYVRRSPVQPLHVAADYQKRAVQNILKTVAVGAVLLFLLWLLLSSNLLSQ